MLYQVSDGITIKPGDFPPRYSAPQVEIKGRPGVRRQLIVTFLDGDRRLPIADDVKSPDNFRHDRCSRTSNFQKA